MSCPGGYEGCLCVESDLTHQPPGRLVERPLEFEELAEVEDELRSATAKYGPMASPHEGYAVILEELDELWEEVRKRPDRRDPARMREEAVQVAAMAVRFMRDCT